MFKLIFILIFMLLGAPVFALNTKGVFSSKKQKSFPKLYDRLLPNEFAYLKRVSNEIGNSSIIDEYQKWLRNKGDVKRSKFLTHYSAFLNSMDIKNAPDTSQLDREWLNLIGAPLLMALAEDGAGQYKDVVCDVAKPALHLNRVASKDNEIPLGSTKLGGLPDLPLNFRWPMGKDCKAYYSLSTENIEEYAGFVGQINLKDFKNTSIENRVKTTGVISIFCYQIYDSDNVDIVGIKLFFFDENVELKRTEPQVDLKVGNKIIEEVYTVQFTENIHIPDHTNPLGSKLPKKSEEYDYFSEYYHQENSDFFLGYYEMTEAYEDPTPNSSYQNFITVTNQVGHELTIQIPAEDLLNGIVDKAILSWVSFDN